MAGLPKDGRSGLPGPPGLAWRRVAPCPATPYCAQPGRRQGDRQADPLLMQRTSSARLGRLKEPCSSTGSFRFREPARGWACGLGYSARAARKQASMAPSRPLGWGTASSPTPHSSGCPSRTRHRTKHETSTNSPPTRTDDGPPHFGSGGGSGCGPEEGGGGSGFRRTLPKTLAYAGTGPARPGFKQCAASQPAVQAHAAPGHPWPRRVSRLPGQRHKGRPAPASTGTPGKSRRSSPSCRYAGRKSACTEWIRAGCVRQGMAQLIIRPRRGSLSALPARPHPHPAF